jgi:hypothetical protein
VFPLLVLKDALPQIAGHTDIERVAPAGYYVREIDFLVHGKNVS